MKRFLLLFFVACLFPFPGVAREVDIFEARHIALLQGVGRINSIDKFGNDGSPYYRFEMLDRNKTATEIIVDARSGEILSNQVFRLSRHTWVPPGAITQKEAKKIALNYVMLMSDETGAVIKHPRIYDAKFNLLDNEIVTYQIGVRVKKDRYTVFVDPMTGRVLSAQQKS